MHNIVLRAGILIIIVIREWSIIIDGEGFEIT